MRPSHLCLIVTAVLFYQVDAGYGGNCWGYHESCAHECIENLNLNNTDCGRDEFYFGWDCVCTDQPALDAVNNCITSSCSSSDQNSIFAAIAQACANVGSPITAAPAEATFSATSGGTLFASGFASGYSSCASGIGRGSGHGWAGHCSRTTFTDNWDGWVVSWSGFDNGNCSNGTEPSLTSATLPPSVSATTSGSASLSLGATVTTTINGQTLTGTIFSAEGEAASATAAQQNGCDNIQQKVGVLAAIVVALVAATGML